MRYSTNLSQNLFKVVSLSQQKFRPITIACFLWILSMVAFTSTVFANGGIGYKGIKVNMNGTNSWYNIHGVAWGYQGCGDYGSTFYNSGAANWASTNLGTFSTTATLQITGYAVVGWSDAGDYVAGKLEYKVWKQGDAEPGTWTVINVGNYQSPTSGATQVVCTSGNDKVVGYNNGTTSIQPGVVGTYNFKVKGFGRVQYTGGGGGSFNPNDGSELTATFTIVAAPSISSLSALPNNGTSTNGYVGSTITVSGSNFTGVNAVSMSTGGTISTFSVVDANTITFALPAGYSGTVTVTHPSNGSSGASSSSIVNLGYRTTTSGGWSTPGTWLGNAVPASSTTTNVTIAHDITGTTGDVNVGQLTVNVSTTLTITASTSITVNTASTNSGTITNNGTLAVSGASYTNSGTITINGTFQINQGGFLSGTNLSYSSGTLVFNHSSGTYGVANAHAYWPSTGGPTNVTVNNNGSTGVQLQTGASRTIAGTLTLNRTFDIQSAGLLTVNGIVQINANGNFSTNAPVYGSASTLIYSSGGSYGISTEWTGNNTTAGTGVPNNVTIQNNTTLTFPTTSRGCAGNFNISSGGATLNGTSGDLYVAGNFTNSGTFTHSSRAVFLNGGLAQTLNGTLNNTGATNCFPFLLVNKTANGVTLNTPVNVTNTLTLTTGIITTTSTNILNITATTTGSIAGGSATAYIDGPLQRSLPASLISGSTYVFPVGKTGSGYYPVSLVNPTTTTGTITITAEAFATGSGGSNGTGITTISSSEYWSVASTGNFTNSSYSLTRPTAVSPNNVIGRSTTLAGAYNSILGTAAGSSITNSSTAAGAPQQYFVLAQGALPSISTSGTLSNFGSVCVGSNSAEQFYTVSGDNLVGSVTVTAPTGYQVSTTGGGVGFGSSVVLTQTGGDLDGEAVTVYVRFAPGSAGVLSGNITHTSSGATTVNVAVSGTGVASGGWIGGASGDWNTGANWCGGVAPTNASAVVIPSGVTVTVDGASVAQSVTINGTLLGSSNTLTVSGNWVNNGTFTAGTGTVVFDATAVVSGTNNTTFNNVTISSGVNFGASKSTINGTGTLRINGGGFVNTNAPTYASGSTLQYNTGGTYGRGLEWQAANPGRPHHVVIAGNTTLDYPNNAGANTTNRSITGDLEIQTGSSLYLDFGAGTSSGALTVAGSVTIAGNLSLGDGSPGDLYVGGNWTHTGGTFAPNGRAVFFNGSGTQTINQAETFAFLLNDKSGGGNLVLAENVTVTNTLTLTTANTATLTVSAGKRLTFASGVFNGDAVVLKSTSAGTASIGNITGSLTGATNVTVERYIPANRRWRALATPLRAGSNQFVSGVWQTGSGSTGVSIWKPGGGGGYYAGGVGPSILGYNNGYVSGAGAFVAPANTTGAALFGTGNPTPYLVFVTEPYTATPTRINSGSLATTLTATGTLFTGNYTSGNLPVNLGFYMLPNPYPAAITLSSGVFNGLADKFWTWDPKLGTTGNYQTTTAGVTAPTGGSYSGSSRVIPQGGAFWVQSDGAGSVDLTESAKSGTDFNIFGRTNNGSNEILRVNLSSSTGDVLYDGIAAVYNNTSTTGIDAADAQKISLGGENISIRRFSQDWALEFRPLIDERDTIFLRLHQVQQKTYRLDISGEEFASAANLTAVLQDLFLNTETPLNIFGSQNISFTVTANAASAGDRFRIVFRPNVATPVIDLFATKGISIYPNPVVKGGDLQVQFRNSAAGRYEVVLYNVAGVQVLKRTVVHAGGTGVQKVAIPENLAAGTYIAEITSNGQKGKIKITIQ